MVRRRYGQQGLAGGARRGPGRPAGRRAARGARRSRSGPARRARGDGRRWLTRASPYATGRVRRAYPAAPCRTVNAHGATVRQAHELPRCRSELTRRFDIVDRLAFEVLSLGSAGSWVLKNYSPVPGLVPASPASYDYTPGFSTDLKLKDMRLSQSAAASLGASTGLAACASAMYQLASNQGYGHKDCSYVFEVVRGGTAKASPASTARD